MPVEAVSGVTQFGAAEGADALEARVVAQPGNHRRLLVEIVDPVADLVAVDRRPPRVAVVGPGVGHRLLDLGAHQLDLVGVEHPA